jgi:uncharacterized membrane protein YdbT with pleckstrin-like domain
MGSYVQENLISGESVLFETKMHWFSFVPLLIVAIIIGLMTKGIGLLVIVLPAIRYFTSEMGVTTKRVIIKYGWFGNHTLEVNLSKVESVAVSQGILGKILGFGTIIVIGTGGTKQPFSLIADPNGFRKALMNEQNKDVAQ